MATRTDSEELKGAISKLIRGGKEATGRPAVSTAPGCVFGAVVEERLKELERSLGEVKARLNGLIFLVVGAVVLEIVLRLLR